MGRLSCSWRNVVMLVWGLFFISCVPSYGAEEQANNPPVAQFKVEKQYVVQGEKINYIDQSYDPDGDEIVERKWTGQLPFFFQPGVRKVTLQVKDSRGLWSKPAELNITVWREVKVDSFNRLVNQLKEGSIVDLTEEETLSFGTIKPVTKDWGPTLLLSNSPEVIQQNGILYADNASGDIRLFYYHLNKTKEKKKIYILAENISDQVTNIQIHRQGQAGPSTNELLLGKVGLASYFSSQVSKKVTLTPGETVILNTQGSKKNIDYGQIAHELMDVSTDSLVRFSFIVAGEKENILEKYKGDMIILPKDNHPRGTFSNANRSLEIPVLDSKKQRVALGDNKTDLFQVGKDNLTGEDSVNYGNYGVLYSLSLASKYKNGLVISSRGGPFSGAVVGTDGKINLLPKNGIVKSFTQGVVSSFFNPSDDYREKMLFMTPVASSTPIDLLVAPEISN